MWGQVLPLLLAVHVRSQDVQPDPCKPNPCGENTRCSSTNTRGSPVISCECLIGYEVPKGGDPFDGCEEKKVQSQTASPVPRDRGEVSTTSTSASPVQPLATTQAPVRIPAEVEDPDPPAQVPVPKSIDSRLQEGKRPAFLLPRRNEEKGIVRPNEIVDVDNPDLFPEECLVHEDCDTSEYCSPPPENKCTDACSLDVCGDKAVCTTRLHRPVCSCPHGFHGNPYDKCRKTPSRVGMKFRRR